MNRNPFGTDCIDEYNVWSMNKYRVWTYRELSMSK